MSANSSENQPNSKDNRAKSSNPDRPQVKAPESPSKNPTLSTSESKNPNNQSTALKSLDYYTIGKTIGQGTFGKVKSAIHKLTGERVAIKILEKSKIANEADVERITREIHILKLIRHPHIIQLYEIIETSTQLFLVMEYADGGELFEYIVAHKRVKEREASKFFQEIIAGVEYLHQLNVVHRDLKPENLLLDHNKRIKIVDFGLSNTYKDGELLKTACGSPCYAAPEMIAGKKYKGLAADIWSCGIILFALVCGYLPFEDPNTSQLYKKILKGEFNIPKFISPECKELIQRILTTDPARRYTIEDIRRHPWFNQVSSAKEVQGIIMGVHKIPIDNGILNRLAKFKFDIKLSERLISTNRHNHITTTYYLLLKRHLLNGGKSPADINSDNFDVKLLTKPESNDDAKTIKNNFLANIQKPEKKAEAQKKSLMQTAIQFAGETIDREKPEKSNTDSEQAARGRSCPNERKQVPERGRVLGSTGGSSSGAQDFSGVHPTTNASTSAEPRKEQPTENKLQKLFSQLKDSIHKRRESNPVETLNTSYTPMYDKSHAKENLNDSIMRDVQSPPANLANNTPLHKPHPPPMRKQLNVRVNNLLNNSIEKEKVEEKVKEADNNAGKEAQKQPTIDGMTASANIKQRNLVRNTEPTRATVNENEYQRLMTSSTVEDGNNSTIQSTPTHQLAKRSRGHILTEILNNSKDFSIDDSMNISYTQESTKGRPFRAPPNNALQGSIIVDALNSSVYRINHHSKSPGKNPKGALLPKEPPYTKINNAVHINNIYRTKLFVGNMKPKTNDQTKLVHPTTAGGIRERGRQTGGNFYDYRKFGTPSYESRESKSINMSTLDHTQIPAKPEDGQPHKRKDNHNISFDLPAKKIYGPQDLNATMIFPGSGGKKYNRNNGFMAGRSLNGTHYFGLVINQKPVLK